MKPYSLFAALALLASTCLAGETSSLKIQSDAPGLRINPSMWGVFFEDINFGADGGIYAELVKNGSFEFPDARIAWKKLGGASANDFVRYIARSDATPANLRLAEISSDGTTAFGLSNEGFRGIGVKAGERYDFTIDLRTTTESGPLKLKVELAGAKDTLASATLEAVSKNWTKLSVTLVPSATEAKAKLNLSLEGKGSVQIDRVSLFPRKTWKERPQGLRADMVQMLADMKPGFVRFPGGCIVEGSNLALRYQWKDTILPREQRALLFNRWNNEMKDHQAPDYYQSFGLGFFEYFQLCDDIGAEPLPILNCGMACQFNSGELAPMDGLTPYIQDALDLIEFANGPVTSTWGAKRAALGHPAPFKMKLLGVGNEQWGPQYVERYEAFAKALKAKYPEIQLIVAAGPSPGDSRFNYLWQQWKRLKVDIVDEHSYSPPTWFIDGFKRYDSYDRSGPKVFVGEYACHTKDRKNSLTAALAEAVFMIGMERNADIVRLAAYAPLFAHVDAWQWKPDMIWVDNLRAMPTPSYLVQKLFALNRGDVVLPVELSQPAGTPRLYASAVRDEKTAELVVKIANPEASAIETSIALPRLKGRSGKVHQTVLSGATGDLENTLDEPTRVAPVESELPALPEKLVIAPFSFTILRIKTP